MPGKIAVRAHFDSGIGWQQRLLFGEAAAVRIKMDKQSKGYPGAPGWCLPRSS